jgi:L-2,4-diaminobutyrate decarboxylase
MTDLIKQAYDPEQFRQQGHHLVDLLADYLARMQSGGSVEKVLHYAAPDELYQRWKDDLAQAPNRDLNGYFEALLHDTIHIHHPKYMGHQTSNVAPIAALAGLAGGLPDPGMGAYEQGTTCVTMEWTK